MIPAMTIGIVPVARFAAWLAGVPYVTIDVHVETNELGGESGKPFVISLRPPGLYLDRLTFQVAELAQTVAKGGEQDGQVAGIAACVRGRGWREDTDPGHFRRRLRVGGERQDQE